MSKWEAVHGVPYRVNISCHMHDTRLCQIDVEMTNNYSTKQNRCNHVKKGAHVHNVNVKSKDKLAEAQNTTALRLINLGENSVHQQNHGPGCINENKSQVCIPCAL